MSDTNPPYIDTLLAKHPHDEEQVYRALGLIDPHSDFASRSVPRLPTAPTYWISRPDMIGRPKKK